MLCSGPHKQTHKVANPEEWRFPAGYRHIRVSHNQHYADTQRLCILPDPDQRPTVLKWRDKQDSASWSPAAAAADDDDTPRRRDPLDQSAWHDGGWLRDGKGTPNAGRDSGGRDRSTFGRQRLPVVNDDLEVKPAPTVSRESTPLIDRILIFVCVWLWGPVERSRPIFCRKIFWLIFFPMLWFGFYVVSWFRFVLVSLGYVPS